MSKFKAIIEAFKPFFVKPGWSIIAVALTYAGIALITPLTFNLPAFFWCVFVNWNAKEEMRENCTLGGEVISNSVMAIVVGLLLIGIAVFLVLRILRMQHEHETAKTEPQKANKGKKIVPPKDGGVSLYEVIRMQSGKDGVTVKYVGLSSEDCAAFIVSGDFGDRGFSPDTVSLIQSLIAKLDNPPPYQLRFYKKNSEYVLEAIK